jgi:hypothetical protein
MALDAADKSFLTRRLILTWIGVSLLSLLVTSIVAYELSDSIKTLGKTLGKAIFGVTAAHSGDTPVVLVGGSLLFRARDAGLLWVEDTPQKAYHLNPQYDVASIVVKKKPNKGGDDPDTDDSTASSDKLRVDVSNAASWEVDEFIPGAAGKPDVRVASITPDSKTSYQIDLTATQGYLCPVPAEPNTKHLTYSANPCPAPGQEPSDAVTFSSIQVIVTVGGQTQTWGTLNCVDANSDKTGQCRIVFRGD